uniref:Uncharacterized protein n=1 Tax=uncultured bacterium contig00011 TaxID=1181503 RepID=A0A806K0K2_9BACT|nr:hypothetical protein [uncultured bacterium contig00011]
MDILKQGIKNIRKCPQYRITPGLRFVPSVARLPQKTPLAFSRYAQ